MGRFQHFSNSEKVTKRRSRTAVSVVSFLRGSWAKQMQVSSSNLLEDKDDCTVHSMERSHMTCIQRSRPSMDRAVSLPALLIRKTSSSCSTRLPEEDEMGDPRLLRTCLPRFSNTVIINKEDLESRLEEFRTRMSERYSSCESFLDFEEEELIGEEEEQQRGHGS